MNRFDFSAAIADALKIMVPAMRQRLLQCGALALIALGLAACTTPGPDGWSAVEAGPLMYDYRLTLETGHEAGVFGPIFTERHAGKDADAYTQRTIRPFLLWRSMDDGRSEEVDVLYPLLTYHRTGDEYRFQIMQLIGFSGGRHQVGGDENSTTLFPFYFSRDSGDPARDFRALFPIYGTMKNRMQRDRIDFVLFPLYAKSQKRDVVTRNYLYPFFHVREGDRLRGWQFWPVMGREVKDYNPHAGAANPGGHTKSFFAWPFYSHAETGIGTDKHTTIDALLPLYSMRRSPQRADTTILWPFFNYTADAANKYTEYSAPWPFIVWGDREGNGTKKSTHRVWPLFGREQSAELTKEFYLWPLYQKHRLDTQSILRERDRVLGVLYSRSHEVRKETGEIRDRTDVWPLYSYKRTGATESRQFPSLFEPLRPDNPGMERNYSPLVAIWRSESNSATGVSSSSFLWHLVRTESSAKAEKCSLLFGLFRYKSNEEARELRLLWLLPIRWGGPAR